MISSRVRHNKTHPNGHHDVHARQTRDRRGKNRQNFYLQPEWRSSAVPVCPICLTIDRSDPQLTLGSKIFTCDRTWDGGCNHRRKWTCTKRAGANQQTRVRQRSSNTRRGSPGDFLQRRSGRVHRHVHLALACASRTGLSKTSPFDQMGRCSGQNGSTRRAN